MPTRKKLTYSSTFLDEVWNYEYKTHHAWKMQRMWKRILLGGIPMYDKTVTVFNKYTDKNDAIYWYPHVISGVTLYYG